MDWSKVKNIIILLLLLVNGFLLVLVGVRRSEVRRYERAALSQTVQVLANSGIQVDEAGIGEGGGLAPQQAERSVEAERRLVAGLLGEDVSENNRGGGLYIYQGESGEVRIWAGGTLSVTCFEGTRWQTRSPEEHSAGLLLEMGVQAELLDSSLADGSGTLTYRQLWEESPLFSCRLVFTYEKGRLCAVEGSALVTGGTVRQAAEQLSLSTVLLRFLDEILSSGDICSSISTVRMGYRMIQSLPGGVELVPVWLVSSNTADYYVDAQTGQITRVTEETTVRADLLPGVSEYRQTG